METLIGLLLVLLGVFRGVETFCDGRQNGAQCYGALGGTVVLQLMDNATEISTYQWSDRTGSVLRGGKGRTLINRIADRSVFTPSNGTFRINQLSRSDDGEYTLQIFNLTGQETERRTLQLTIQAPVSSVSLAFECLSQGEMRVSCSSEGGDGPQYSWTLDGQTLTEAQLLSGDSETDTITLRQDVSGELVCSVRNHISIVSKVETISTCGFRFIDCTLINGTHVSQWFLEFNDTMCSQPTPASTTEGKETAITVSIKPSTIITSSHQTVTSSSTDERLFINNMIIVGGILAALLILLMVGVAVVCTHRKNKKNKHKEKEDEQELTYADVNIVQRQGRQKPQRSEVQVEYGQVKISGRAQPAAEATGGDCVYAMVLKGR